MKRANGSVLKHLCAICGQLRICCELHSACEDCEPQGVVWRCFALVPGVRLPERRAMG